ncbi:tetratricopeptide repeat protein [Microbacterium trichothecenolyticum]|uniref:Tetratricopeptide (TPR) repeat protein n=1 Tax=Microbacterium trichothecenolyticum TaxID=69370 RepID=A0ABU0TPM6_MICTR|nr:tetratricopeptide repeat protein [Microbacterium trichothecenolyticum]MDQ1121619.1 tetratricopeptide (TPR) repeat protein [Microbacterium trichothecenolyticum]
MTEEAEPASKSDAGDDRSFQEKVSLTAEDLIRDAQRWYEKEDYSAARELMERAKDIGGGGDEFHHNLGLIYMAQGDYLEAIRSFEESVESIPDGLVNRGYCWELVGDSERARADYLAALQVDSQDVAALVNLGTLDLAEDRVDEAKAVLSRAVGIDPRCNWQLADVFLELGDLKSAERALELAERAGEERATAQLSEVREMIRIDSVRRLQ